MNLNFMGKKVTIHINGCSVTCPEEQEQLYREALKDKWIDGYRVYVENGEVKTDHDPTIHVMSPETMIELLIDANNKRYALAGKY